ncbi:hypothetical protein SK128_014992 [Halocaridina rubra]|uniref:Uncharacterized protein n=1 Tax=Halocaridina rubra TaxID=373956 RepID=A0AAN8X5R4_HALRR
MKLFLSVMLFGVCYSQRIPLPNLTDEEVQGFLNNLPAVVDCIIAGETPGEVCHPIAKDVERFIPELARNNFQCNCDGQRHINAFREALKKDNTSFRRLSRHFNDPRNGFQV